MTFGFIKKPKPIDQFKNGILVKHFDSMAEDARELDIESNVISNHLRGLQKTVKGFTFKLCKGNQYHIWL